MGFGRKNKLKKSSKPKKKRNRNKNVDEDRQLKLNEEIKPFLDVIAPSMVRFLNNNYILPLCVGDKSLSHSYKTACIVQRAWRDGRCYTSYLYP